jgi:sodium/proline symporter
MNKMSATMILQLIAFVMYLVMMILIGFKFMKNSNSSEDFYLGGRNLGPWTTALSAEASDMSGWLLMGLPGVAYLTGMKSAFWTAVGLELGTYLNWLLVAKPLRKYSIACGDSITIPEFFTNRFKDKTHIISLLSVIFILLFFTIYTASGFVSCGKLLSSVFGIPYIWAVVIGMAVILIYTVLGGYLAVCTTDFVQGTLMFLALIVTSIVMIAVLGGPADAAAKVNVFGAQFLNPFVDDGTGFGAKDIISSLGWGLGYFGMPHILVRFMGIRSNKEIAISRRIAMIWVTLAFIGALVIGAFAKVYLLPEVLEGTQSETVVIETLKKMYPAFLSGIFLCAILAAAMSTADSQLLVAASAFSEDFCATVLGKKLNPKTTVRISRITVLVIAAIAFVLSLNQNSSIFGLVSYAWAGFGATFGPLVLLALFWRGATNKGAIAGLIGGGVTVVLWHNLHGGIFDIYEIIPGFIVCLVLAVVVSLCDKNKDPEMLADYDKYKNLAD